MPRPPLTLGLAAVLLWFFTCGFDWPGRLNHLQREFEQGDASQRVEVIRLLAHTSDGGAAELLLRALEDDDQDVRLEAAAVIGQVGVGRAVPVLLDWMDDGEPSVRAAAATGLGKLGDVRTLPTLVRALGDARAEVRAAAIGALGTLGSQDATEPLLQHLTEPDTGVRALLIQTLGQLGDPRAVPALIGQPQDVGPELQVVTLRALGTLGDTRALGNLLSALADTRQEVRVAACEALGRLGDGRAFDALAEAVRAGDPMTGRAALAALASLDADPRPARLATELVGHPTLAGAATDLLVQQGRRQALSGGPTHVLSALVESLASDPASATSTAERLAPTLAVLADVTSVEAALPYLIAALPMSHSPSLLAAIGKAGRPSALLPLLEQLERVAAEGVSEAGSAGSEGAPGAGVDAILKGLSELMARTPPDGRAADPLLDLLPRTAGQTRVTVVRLLGRTGADRILPAVRPLIGHAEPELRTAAIEAVGALADAQAAPLLMARVLDMQELPGIRHGAAVALGRCAGPGEVLHLLDAVVGKAPADRHALLRALAHALPRLAEAGALGPKLEAALLTQLAPLLSHPDAQLSACAFDALEAWHPDAALRPLAGLLRHPSARRRARAAQAMAAYPPAQSRPILRQVLRLATPRTVVAAVVALGEVGDGRDLDALLKLMQRQHWPAPGAIAYAVARMAERGVLKPHSTQRALCRLTDRREPVVRANLAAAMAHLGVGACHNGLDPMTWFDGDELPAVRLAALRWMQAAARADKLPAEVVTARRARCLRSEPNATIARACEQPLASAARADDRPMPSPPSGHREETAERNPLEVFAYGRDGQSLLRDRLVALRFDDGTVFVGYSDANGRIGLRHAPAGDMRLEDPGSWPLAPAKRGEASTSGTGAMDPAAQPEAGGE